MISGQSKVVIGSLPTGEEIVIHCYTIDSGMPGPTVYIQANVHGPEIAGVPVALELVKVLPEKLQKGKVLIVPYANPWGTNTKLGEKQLGYTNFNSDSYKNWNRIYPDLSSCIKPGGNLTKQTLQLALQAWYDKKTATLQAKKEVTLAYTLLSMALQADYVIDLHTAGNCIHHLYTFPHQKELATSFGIEQLLEVPYEMNGIFDESLIYPWAKYNSSHIPVSAFTLELDGDGTVSNETKEKGVTSVLNFLSAISMVPEQKTKTCTYFISSELEHGHLFSPYAGIFMPSVKPGVTVHKNESIGTITEVNGKVHNIEMPFDAYIYQLPASQAVETGQTILGYFGSQKSIN